MALETKEKKAAKVNVETEAPAKVETPNALAVITGAGANPLAAMIEDEGKQFLPHFKIPYGVEALKLPLLDEKGQQVMVKGQPATTEATGKFVLAMNKNLTEINTPYIISAICIRGATRQTVVKDGKKVYVRTMAPTLSGKEPNPKHLAQLAASEAKGSGVDKGNTALIAVITEGKCVIGLMECFKTLASYWCGKKGQPGPLHFGVFTDNNAIEVSIGDHSVNTTKSGNGFDYYDSRKFNQWRQVQLTKEQRELIAAALNDRAETINQWLAKED